MGPVAKILLRRDFLRVSVINPERDRVERKESWEIQATLSENKNILMH